MNGIGNALPSSSLASSSASAPGANALQEQDKPAEKAKFSDVWNKIQATMGQKPEKQREIKKQLGKDDFMRIMITQMQHQDPTEPFDANKLAQEIAQITAVEQLSNVNRALTKLSTQNQPLERLGSTHLIGKVVTVDRSRFPHKAEAMENLSYTLPEKASEVRVSVVSDRGETVHEQTLSGVDAGSHSIMWDGRKKNTLPAEDGHYFLRIAAKSEHGTPIHTSTEIRGRIIGVSFEGKDPIFLVGDAKSQAKVTMDAISKIEDESAAAALPATGVAPVASTGNSTGKFFTFEKGVGSKPLNLDEAPPEVKNAIQQYTQMKASAKKENSEEDAEKKALAMTPADPDAARAVAEAPRLPGRGLPAEDKGFPNGMNVYHEKGGERK